MPQVVTSEAMSTTTRYDDNNNNNNNKSSRRAHTSAMANPVKMLSTNPESGSGLEDPDPDDFRKFNQFFLVRRYICGKVFMKIRSVVANRRTKRETNAGHYIA